MSNDIAAENRKQTPEWAIGRTASSGIGKNLILNFLPDDHIHAGVATRFKCGMKGFNGHKLRERRHILDSTMEAMDRMERYCDAHPGSPSAARLPQLVYRGQLWVALLGPSVEEGIVGIGPTVEAALRAFDAQYLAGLRPPNQSRRRGIYDSRVTAA